MIGSSRALMSTAGCCLPHFLLISFDPHHLQIPIYFCSTHGPFMNPVVHPPPRNPHSRRSRGVQHRLHGIDNLSPRWYGDTRARLFHLGYLCPKFKV